MGKTAVLVLLKLFINGNQRCHPTDDPEHMNVTLLSYVNNIQSMISEDKKTTTQ